MKKLNKTVKVAIAVALILAMASIGFANAVPRPVLQQVNLLYSTSVEPVRVPDTPWLPVAGNQISDFKLKLDGDPNSWYYLDIKFIKPELSTQGVYLFYLTVPPDEGTAFWNYWAAKDVTEAHFLAHFFANPNPTTWPWQSWMWLIIHGIKPPGMDYYQVPMFGLRYDGEEYDLRDALVQYSSQATLSSPLRLNGDYPLGTYTFTCKGAKTVTQPYEDLPINILAGVSMTITFR